MKNAATLDDATNLDPAALTSRSISDEVLDTGRLVDGRVHVAHFSKLAARFAEALGMRSRLMRSVDAAQEAADHLKSAGFEPTAIDRVLWLINEPFPMSLLPAAERLFSEPPVGVALRDGRPERLHGDGLRQGISLWRTSLSEGAAQMGGWPEHQNKQLVGVGGKRLVALVALGSGKAHRRLARAGLSTHEGKRFVAGHELGHVIFKVAGHAELFSDILTRLGVDEDDDKGRKLVSQSAEELFADALGALASPPSHLRRLMAGATHMRAQSTPFSTPTPIYMRGSPLRRVVWERLEGGGWSGLDGGVDLATECLAIAVSHFTSMPVRETRARVADAFELAAGRPWSSPRATTPRGSGRAPR